MHSEVRQFYGAVQAAKALPDRVKLPPAPKAPESLSAIAVDISNALGSAFGFETPHHRALKAHAQAMKQWRVTCKELRQQDEEAWTQMRTCNALALLTRHRTNRQSSRTVAVPIPPIASAAPRPR